MTYDYYTILSIAFLLAIAGLYIVVAYRWALNDGKLGKYLASNPELTPVQKDNLSKKYKAYTSFWFAYFALICVVFCILFTKNNKNVEARILPREIDDMLINIAIKNSPILFSTTLIVGISFEFVRQIFAKLISLTGLATLAAIFTISPSYANIDRGASINNKIQISAYKLISARVKFISFDLRLTSIR